MRFTTKPELEKKAAPAKKATPKAPAKKATAKAAPKPAAKTASKSKKD